MPALYPVIGFDAWESETNRSIRSARRARVFFAIRSIFRYFVEGVCIGLVIATAAALALRILGILAD